MKTSITVYSDGEEPSNTVTELSGDSSSITFVYDTISEVRLFMSVAQLEALRDQITNALNADANENLNTIVA